MNTSLLKFGKGNAKLSKSIATFTLPSGTTCPGAKDCLAYVALEGDSKRVVDGPHQKFRCFMVSAEVRSPGLYALTRHNRDLLAKAKGFSGKRELLKKSLEQVFSDSSIEAVRVHVGGDFWSQDYFDAWMSVAAFFKKKRFYAYTKSLKMWISARDRGIVPSNFKLTASAGGKFDHLIDEHGLRKATVVLHPEEAAALNIEIDHDDTHAMGDGGDFALLIHGPQPAKSEASLAKSRLGKEGVRFSYSLKTSQLPAGEVREGFALKPAPNKKTPVGSERRGS